MTDETADFPAGYTEYLARLNAGTTEAVLPVMKQSIAEGRHGVLIARLGHDTQAEVSPEVPFGEVRETVR